MELLLTRQSNVVNFFLFFELDLWSRYLSKRFLMGHCLFRAVRSTKDADLDKYGYSCYIIELDTRSQLLLPSGELNKNKMVNSVVFVA